MPPQSNFKWYVIIGILIIFLLIAIAIIMLLIFKNDLIFRSTIHKAPSNLDAQLFDSQSGNLTGKVTNIDGNKLNLENKAGIKVGALIADGFVVSDLSEGSLKTSSDVKDIPINKEGVITLVVKDGEYRVGSIFYPQTSNFNPVATNSAVIDTPTKSSSPSARIQDKDE